MRYLIENVAAVYRAVAGCVNASMTQYADRPVGENPFVVAAKSTKSRVYVNGNVNLVAIGSVDLGDGVVIPAGTEYTLFTHDLDYIAEFFRRERPALKRRARVTNLPNGQVEVWSSKSITTLVTYFDYAVTHMQYSICRASGGRYYIVSADIGSTKPKKVEMPQARYNADGGRTRQRRRLSV